MSTLALIINFQGTLSPLACTIRHYSRLAGVSVVTVIDSPGAPSPKTLVLDIVSVLTFESEIGNQILPCPMVTGS